MSQGLSRTKPTSSGYGALRTKAKLSFGHTPSEHSWDLPRVGDTPVEFNIKPASSGLTGKYQAPYPVSRGDVGHATPPTRLKKHEIEADLHHDDQSHDRESSPQRQANPTTSIHLLYTLVWLNQPKDLFEAKRGYIECPVQKDPESDAAIIVTGTLVPHPLLK